MSNDQIFRDRARVLDEDLAGRASSAGADGLLAEIVLLEHVAARRRFMPSAGRALLGLAVAAVAVAVVAPAMLAGRTTSVGPQPTTSVSATGEAVARQILLAAAVAVERAPADGDYWRTQVVSQSMLTDPTRSYVLESERSAEQWLAKRPDLRSWRIGQDLGAKPATPRDEVAWRAAGSPTSWRYPRNMKTGNLFAVPFEPLEAAAGERTAERLHGKWKGRAGDLMGESMTWKQVRAIPGEPEKLRSYLEEHITRRLPAPVGYDVEEDLLVAGCADIISRLPASPEARASAYRILASLPGIRAEGEMTDPLGRRGQALSFQQEMEPELFSKVVLVVDPDSGLLLAEVRTNTTRLADGRRAQLRVSTSFQAIGWTDERPDLPTRRN